MKQLYINMGFGVVTGYLLYKVWTLSKDFNRIARTTFMIMDSIEQEIYDDEFQDIVKREFDD